MRNLAVSIRKNALNVFILFPAFFFVTTSLFLGAQESNYKDANDWSFPSDNYWVCAKLKNGFAQLRYEDGSVIDPTGAYSVTTANVSPECGTGWVRLDWRDYVDVRNANRDVAMRLAFHKGGQSYNRPEPAYGYISFDDIEKFDGVPKPSGQADNVPLRGKAGAGLPQVRDGQPNEYGAPSWEPGKKSWDWTHRNGVGCEPTDKTLYTVKVIPQDSPNAIPSDWQYKPNKAGSRLAKYADGGADYGSHRVHYAWLVWSWLYRGDGATKNGGGGQMRSVLRDGQEFYRCPVKSIPSRAYAPNSTNIAGEVTAWYVKTRAVSTGRISPWIYGWMIVSHKENGKTEVLHYSVQTAPKLHPERQGAAD